ncbi:MAG: hypothetical protein ACXVIO_09530, partial [Candidatus Angelobacter sp.]
MHLQSWISRAAGKGGSTAHFRVSSKTKAAITAALDSLIRCIWFAKLPASGHVAPRFGPIALTPVVIAVMIAVAIPVTWGLELSTLAQITITGQYLPFIRSTRLQPSQLKGVVGASTLMVGGLPGLITARHAIAD